MLFGYGATWVSGAVCCAAEVSLLLLLRWVRFWSPPLPAMIVSLVEELLNLSDQPVFIPGRVMMKAFGGTVSSGATRGAYQSIRENCFQQYHQVENVCCFEEQGLASIHQNCHGSLEGISLTDWWVR